MRSRLIFLAQALDNTSPDHVTVSGEELSPDDTARRRAASAEVSDVVNHGTRLFEERGVLLTADHRRFLVEAPCAERDGAGRIAPVVCCGDYENKADDALGAAVADELDRFARGIGRTLLPEHLELVRQSFERLKKKPTRELRYALWAGLLLLLLVISWWLASLRT